jgi:hypothetical protein
MNYSPYDFEPYIKPIKNDIKYERNLEIEARIIKNHDIMRKADYKMNVYGGMGMSGCSDEEIKLLYEELEYMKKFPKFWKNLKELK